MSDETLNKTLALAKVCGFEPIHYRQGTEILDPTTGDRRYWRPATDRNDMALVYPVLRERDLHDDFISWLEALSSYDGFDEASRFGLVEADPAIQFEAACRVLGVEG